MPCDTKTIPDAILCSRGRRTRPCQVAGCGAPAVAQCDYPLHGAQAGKTCDRFLCGAHRVPQAGKNRDYCPTHAEIVGQGTLPLGGTR